MALYGIFCDVKVRLHSVFPPMRRYVENLGYGFTQFYTLSTQFSTVYKQFSPFSTEFSTEC